MKIDIWSLLFKLFNIETVETKEPSVDNINKYYDLHDNVVMKFINKNKEKDVYKKNPVTKDLVINVLSEASKILTNKDYKLYEKYYIHFHGGNGKKMIYDTDIFEANPHKTKK